MVLGESFNASQWLPWGSQLDVADELDRDRPFSRASAENESELLDCDFAISFLISSGVFILYASGTGHADDVPHSDP